MPPTYSDADSQLIADLHRLSDANRRLVKSTMYPAPGEPNVMVRSWKMNEFKYYDIPSPFPTLARGIFTIELPRDEARKEDAPKYRIVARGYDKFFNIGEVPWTTWASLEARTGAPYVLSLKSNGCIIFIASLTPSKLLITSKHSIGAIAGTPLSHAEAGEQWVRKYLEEKGRTEEQLASTLWQNNWTAIAELCDDSFEEHVLGYPPEKTGLHLHGINESTKAFKTLPQSDVDAFADEWGFIKTLSITLDSIPEVKTFTDDVGKTGKWNGEPVEGFVVRTHVTQPRGTEATGASPYPPDSTFFFKVKFDEPYMMYRDWRELTKTLLATKGPLSGAKLSGMRMKRPETRLYVKWVTEQIKQDRKQFDGFSKGKGIISTREKFLEWLEAEKSQGGLKAAKDEREVVSMDVKDKTFGKTIIVPVAIPGCGKTAVSVVLSHLFGFGHTQSDDVHVKKAGPVFIRNVVKLLGSHNVVIADKNNHLRQHREALRDATSKMSPPVRLLALNWCLDKPSATIHRICGDRILHRGENHQTLRADTKDKMHEEVIWKFITSTEELLVSEVDACVEMDLAETLEEAVGRAVDGCVRVLGVERPSPEKIIEAINVAKGYAVTVKTHKTEGKQRMPRYFALLPEVDLEDIIENRLALEDDLSEESRAFWAGLKAKGRVSKRPHVTIIHQNDRQEENELWEQCMVLNRRPVPPNFKFTLGNIVWNDRVMAATVDDLEVVDGQTEDLGQDFVSELSPAVGDRLHITVGTRDGQIPAVEAKALVEDWRAKRVSKDIKSMKLNGVVVNGRVKGLL